MFKLHCIVFIAILCISSQAYAWGDEKWDEPQLIIKVGLEPDYLQQRIETRQRRFDVESIEQNRRLRVMHENDRRIQQAKDRRAE